MGRFGHHIDSSLAPHEFILIAKVRPILILPTLPDSWLALGREAWNLGMVIIPMHSPWGPSDGRSVHSFIAYLIPTKIVKPISDIHKVLKTLTTKVF